MGKLTAGARTVIRFALGYWPWDLNIRKEGRPNFEKPDGDTKKLLDSFEDMQWDHVQQAAIVSPRGDKPGSLTPDLQKRAVDERTKLWESLKAKVKGGDETALNELRAFEFLFVEKGKIIVPEYLGATGNRRSLVFYEAAKRVASKHKGEELSKHFDDTITVVVQKFESLQERRLVQMAENDLKTYGFRPLADSERFYAFKDDVANGKVSQNDIRRHTTPSEGQKVYHLILHNGKFPKLKLEDRIFGAMSAADSPNRLEYRRIPGAKLPAITRRTDPEELKRYNDRERAKNRDWEDEKPMTESDVDDAYRGFMEESADKTPKMMDRNRLKDVQNTNQVQVVKRVAEAILTNDSDKLAEIGHIGAQLNAVSTLAQHGEARPIFDALIEVAAIEDEKERVKAVKALAKAVASVK